MLKKGKLFLVVLLTCFLLGNTFGSIAVNAAGNSASQAAQTVGTMAKSDEYKAFWFSYYDYDAYRTKYKKSGNELYYRSCPPVWRCDVQVQIFSVVQMHFR